MSETRAMSSNRQGSRDPARGQWEILSQCVVVVVVRLDSCLTAAATLRCCIDCSSVASSFLIIFILFYFTGKLSNPGTLIPMT